MQHNPFTVANATAQTNYLTAYGKMRTVDLSFRPSVILQAASSYTLYTLSATHRPINAIDSFSLNNLGHKYRVQINVNGEINISVYDEIAVGELILSNMSYVI